VSPKTEKEVDVDAGLQMLVSALTGMVLVPLLQRLKAATGLEGEPMRAIALLSSIIFSVLALLITGLGRLHE